MAESSARAGANVALVKYWGKRDEALNLPAVGSISITLADLVATATVGLREGDQPRFTGVGGPVGGVPGRRMASYLDWLQGEFDSEQTLYAEVETNFPVGAGLASSAAIHCAVAAAAASVLERKLDRPSLSRLARVGSGSAARSAFGGFAQWHRGNAADGSDSIAEPILPPEAWPLRMVVALVREEPKDVSSRDAMRHVAETSALYPGWLEAQSADLQSMHAAIADRDLAAVGRLAEENCLRMHAVTMAARPPVLYWTPATLAAMDAVAQLRSEGRQAYFTIDAGPQVKVLTTATDEPAVAARLGDVPGVRRVLQTGLGKGVEILTGAVPWK